jgi:hypothetical protein
MDTESFCTGVIIVPTVQTSREAVALARRLRNDLLVAFGGRCVHLHQHQ